MENLKNTEEKIKNKINELYEKKIYVDNMILERVKKSFYIYNLVIEQSKHNKILGNINTFIPDFMHELWEKPKSVATILLNSDKDNIKNNLAHFVVHNLYDNISSLNHKDEQLIYIISILLKEEINSLNDINTFFDNKSKSELILGELNEKKEVKMFFKTIILDIIKKMENEYYSFNISFDPNEIEEKLETLARLKCNDIFKNDYKNILKKKEKSFDINKNIKKWELVDDKYINLQFNKEELNKKMLECKDKEMKDFLNLIIEEINASPNNYLNKININNEKYGLRIINYYKNSFIQVIDIIDMLFDNLLNNCELIPYSIKCICKIISILTNKKFPKLIKVEQNKILTIFFFQILFFPFLINLSNNNIINEIMLSEYTIKKISTIVKLLNNIIFGILFTQKNYTPFNWYIIEKMPKIIEFLNSICQVELPSFIEKFINDELPEKYEYNYFLENPDEDIVYRNIFYNIEELYSLIINALNCKNNINIHKMILTNLQKNVDKLKEVKDNPEYKECNEEDNEECNEDSFLAVKKVINCFLLSDSINNQKIDEIMNLKEKNQNQLILKQLKKSVNNDEEIKIKNNIIKVQNYFYVLLNNYEELSKTYKKDKLNDLISILTELKSHSYINSSINMNNYYIPSIWYIDSLIPLLRSIPKNLIENDYDELLNELENEINNSIKKLNFEKLGVFIKYLDEINKEILYYDNIKNIIYDIGLNEKAQYFIKEKKIRFDSKSDDNICKFFADLINENKDFSQLFKKKNINGNIILSISVKSFTNKFPNFSDYSCKYQMDYFEFLKNNIIKIIDNFLILVKNHLKNEKNIKEKSKQTIYYKIYDYIMEKLYDKLFPKEQISKDIKIFQNCFKYIWIDLSNLIKSNKNYVFDRYLPDSINYIKQFEQEKSPRKKIFCLNNLFNCIYNLAKFNGDEIKGLEDELPLLNFTFIKAKPQKIYSNCKYVQLFLEKKTDDIEGNQLAKLLAMCEKMEKISFHELFNINESDYDENCELVKKGIFY